MQLTKEQTGATTIKLTLRAEPEELQAAKQNVVRTLSRNVKVPGFRPGHAPAAMVEKNVDQAVLQAEVIDQLVNQLYFDAIQAENMRPVTQPTVNVIKFVPFTELEFTAEVEAVGEINLPDYKKLSGELPAVKVSAKDVTDVLENLQERAAKKTPAEHAAKKGDEVLIDFSGVDAVSGEAIAGADGKDYPLILGSNSFIPGFEDELIGAKAGAIKPFTLTFPADYGVAALQNKQVAFTVSVRSVHELNKPEVDDAFAATVGPFKSVSELKADIKKQLTAERQREANQTYVNDVIRKIAAKTDIAIPETLVDEEIDRMENEEKQNLAYRGQTWEEHLSEEGVTAEEHRARQREGALQRVTAGLVLGQIANLAHLTVTPEELEVRVQLLKGQYPDPAMQAELDKPENRRDLHSRMMTEKTFDHLLSFASKPKPTTTKN